MEACLHFVSDYFGSAYFISPQGHILTCAHCVVPEDEKSYKDKKNQKQNIQKINKNQEFYLIQPNSCIIQATLINYDISLDCALLYPDKQFSYINQEDSFQFFEINQNLSEKNQQIYCIGQPGYEDLESKQQKQTKYQPFEVSEGEVRGYLTDKYNCSKSDLGPLMHTCWTYWGHSGAPLFDDQGKIVGMHNSWNERNAMRHAMSALSIQKFLEDCNI